MIAAASRMKTSKWALTISVRTAEPRRWILQVVENNFAHAFVVAFLLCTFEECSTSSRPTAANATDVVAAAAADDDSDDGDDNHNTRSRPFVRG